MPVLPSHHLTQVVLCVWRSWELWKCLYWRFFLGPHLLQVKILKIISSLDIQKYQDWERQSLRERVTLFPDFLSLGLYPISTEDHISLSLEGKGLKTDSIPGFWFPSFSLSTSPSINTSYNMATGEQIISYTFISVEVSIILTSLTTFFIV